jgi:uncharacterized protein YwgA
MEALDNILALVNLAGQIEGRTRFQKMVYILKCKGVAFPEKFKYHYYGPFSVDLQLEIDDLVSRNLLREDLNPDPIPTYTYSIEQKSNTNELKTYEALIKTLNDTNRKVLELTSTIFFLRNQEKITDKEVIIKKLNFLKPHLAGYIEEAFKLEEKINRYE